MVRDKTNSSVVVSKYKGCKFLTVFCNHTIVSVVFSVVLVISLAALVPILIQLDLVVCLWLGLLPNQSLEFSFHNLLEVWSSFRVFKTYLICCEI